VTLSYVALGSNLGDARLQVVHAMAALAQLPATRVLRSSQLYRTPPWGIVDQPPFINAAVELDSGLDAMTLLDALLALERQAGRTRTVRYGPRTLDLDLLHVDGVQMQGERLTLPHPRMMERAFVLLPMSDMAPDFRPTGRQTVAERLAELDLTGYEKLP
jgi:2-amino-4-hydroxy-6-hydroxymethyldihydropteridine diphosphokinase